MCFATIVSVDAETAGLIAKEKSFSAAYATIREKLIQFIVILDHWIIGYRGCKVQYVTTFI